jgi:hypothetical protein
MSFAKRKQGKGRERGRERDNDHLMYFGFEGCARKEFKSQTSSRTGVKRIRKDNRPESEEGERRFKTKLADAERRSG